MTDEKRYHNDEVLYNFFHFNVGKLERRKRFDDKRGELIWWLFHIEKNGVYSMFMIEKVTSWDSWKAFRREMIKQLRPEFLVDLPGTVSNFDWDNIQRVLFSRMECIYVDENLRSQSEYGDLQTDEDVC